MNDNEVNLLFEDMEFLLESWAESYDDWPFELQKKAQSATDYFLKDYLAKVMGKFLRYKLANNDDVIRIGTQVWGFSYQWATLCSAIGVEGALGNIDENDVPQYLVACSKPLQLYLVGFLATLVERSKFKEKHARKMASDLSTYISKTAPWLEIQGSIYHTSAKPKYKPGELSPLASELLNIDLA